MDWIDYREKLGIGFNQGEKTKIFITNIYTALKRIGDNGKQIFSYEECFKFCTMTGSILDSFYSNNCVINELFKHADNFIEFIAYYVAIINSKNKASVVVPRKYFIETAENFLNCAHIPYELYYDEKENCFIFPKGAKELDDALVSEPLEWLKDYPNAHKTFCIALKQYSDGTYIRDVADNLRKALETFLQEFLGNNKNLETNKNEICKYLGENNVDGSISGLYQTVINTYKNINDSLVKHNDKIEEKLLEFLLYQTGLLIRMTIVVKNSASN